MIPSYSKALSIPTKSLVNTFSNMPPQRIRNAFDDSRSEASSTKDKQSVYTGTSKGRRNGTSTLAGSNLKDVTNAQTASSDQQEDAAASVRIRCIASDEVNNLTATLIDQLAVFRYVCAPCLSLCPSSRHATRLHFAVQSKDAYATRRWTAFPYNGTASCTSTYWQRYSGAGDKERLQRCHSPRV